MMVHVATVLVILASMISNAFAEDVAVTRSCKTGAESCLNGVAGVYAVETKKFHSRLESFVRNNLKADVQKIVGACQKELPDGAPSILDWWSCAARAVKKLPNWQYKPNATAFVKAMQIKDAHMSESLNACLKNVDKKDLSHALIEAGLGPDNDAEMYTSFEKSYYLEPATCETRLKSSCFCSFGRINRFSWFNQQSYVNRWFMSTKRDIHRQEPLLGGKYVIVGKTTFSPTSELVDAAPATQAENLDRYFQSEANGCTKDREGAPGEGCCSNPGNCYKNLRDAYAPSLEKIRKEFDRAYARGVSLAGDDDHLKFAKECDALNIQKFGNIEYRDTSQREHQKSLTFWQCYLAKVKTKVPADADNEKKKQLAEMITAINEGVALTVAYDKVLSPETGRYKVRCIEEFGADACTKGIAALDNKKLAQATRFKVDAQNLNEQHMRNIETPDIFSKMQACIGDPTRPLEVPAFTTSASPKPFKGVKIYGVYVVEPAKTEKIKIPGVKVEGVSAGLRMEEVQRKLKGFTKLIGDRVDAGWSDSNRSKLRAACGRFFYGDKSIWDMVSNYVDRQIPEQKTVSEEEAAGLIARAVSIQRAARALMLPSIGYSRLYNPLFSADNTMQEEFNVYPELETKKATEFERQEISKLSLGKFVERFRVLARGRITDSIMGNPELAIGMGTGQISSGGAPEHFIGPNWSRYPGENIPQQYEAWAASQLQSVFPFVQQVLKTAGIPAACSDGVGTSTCNTDEKVAEAVAHSNLKAVVALLSDRERFAKPASRDLGESIERLCSEQETEHGGVPLEALLDQKELVNAVMNKQIDPNTGFDKYAVALVSDCYEEYKKHEEYKAYIRKAGVTVGTCLILTLPSAWLGAVGCTAAFTISDAIDWKEAKAKRRLTEDRCRFAGILSNTCTPDQLDEARQKEYEAWNELRGDAFLAAFTVAVETEALANLSKMSGLTRALGAAYKDVSMLTAKQLVTLRRWDMALLARGRKLGFSAADMAARREIVLKLVRGQRDSVGEGIQAMRKLLVNSYDYSQMAQNLMAPLEAHYAKKGEKTRMMNLSSLWQVCGKDGARKITIDAVLTGALKNKIAMEKYQADVDADDKNPGSVLTPDERKRAVERIQAARDAIKEANDDSNELLNCDLEDVFGLK